jgi:Gpi18-like mannosyltransferase
LSRRLVLLLAAYVCLRGWLAVQPGYTHDLRAYRRWAVAAASGGIASIYRDSDMDYPPLYAYVLAPLGKLYLWLGPDAAARSGRPDPLLWTALAKLPPLAFDLVIAVLLQRLGARAGGAAWRWLLPAAYLANPAVLFDGGYWGQPDSIHGAFVLAAFLSIGGPRAWPAWALLALGILMKPLAAPYAPLLLLVSLWRHGPVRTAGGLGVAAVVVVLVFAPFIATGGAVRAVERVAFDLDRMPYASVNAHNIWWRAGAWRSAEAPLFGPMTATHIGLLLFGLVYLALLREAFRLHRRQAAGLSTLQVLALAAAVCASFFMLSTHMHENHLFGAIPLLVPLIPAGRWWTALLAALSLGVLLNLALHDLTIPGSWPLTLGGPAGLERPSHGRLFYRAELLAVRFGTLWNLACFAVFLGGVFRGRLAALAGLPAPPAADPS